MVQFNGMRVLKLLLVIAGFSCTAIWMGCQGQSELEPGSPAAADQDEPVGGPTAAEVLARLRNTYRSTRSYADNAVMVFSAVLRSTGSEQETPFLRTALAYKRPNKLSLTYQKTVTADQEKEEYKVVSNGQVVRSFANEVTDQIHEAVAPVALSPENFLPEPQLRTAVLEDALENVLPQLALLFASDEETLVFPAQELRLLKMGRLDGQDLYRLELGTPAGARILWIDRDDYSLRRMELPIDNQRRQLNPGGQFSRISIWIDFENVSLDPELDDELFELAGPEGARRVRRFIPPPPPAPPEYLGKPVGQFEFVSLAGEPVTRQTLEGKVVVLDFWSTNCPPCKQQTPVLEEMYQHFTDSDDVSFLAVSTDSRFVTNDQVSSTLAKWGSSMPIVRDLQSTGYQELNIRQTPTLLLIDREGRLQSFQIGMHQEAQPLIDMIQRAIDGEDLVATDRITHQGYVDQYHEALETATIQGELLPVAVEPPEVPPRSLPENLLLEPLWATPPAQLQHPDDLLYLPAGGGMPEKLLVLDAEEALVELDLNGKQIGRHVLPEHESRQNGFLRSWVNGQGKQMYLVSGVGWQRVIVLDDQFQPLLTFPDELHSGVGDALIADLAGSGSPALLVGYWGGRGLQCGTLDGRRLWTNRLLDHVVQVGTGPADSQGKQTLLCTSTRGTLLQVSAEGRAVQELYVAGHSLMHFATQPSAESLCGLSVGKPGEYRVVGFDLVGKVAWEFELPVGEYLEQLPRLLSVELPDGEPGWLAVSAGGSLHWLSLTGEQVARFDVGEVPTGVATAWDGGRNLLFLSTADGLSAWQLKPLPDSVDDSAAPSNSEQSSATASDDPLEQE